MTSRRDFLLLAAGACAAWVGASGCSSAVESGHGTALDSVNLEEMTDRMAAGILADPRVRHAIAAARPLRVVDQPVENRMTGEVLPRGEAEAFTARVRWLLTQHAPDDFEWIINRDTFYRLRARELDVPLGPAPEAQNPRFALWGTFYSLTDESSKRRSSSYLCLFELTDLDRRSTLWTGRYEVKKVAVKGFLD